MRNKYQAHKFEKMSFHFIFYKYEYFVHNESWHLYVYSALCFLFVLKAKYNYKSIVTLLQAIGGVLATLFIPYESPGNTYATKLLFIKVHLMLGASIIIGNIESKFFKYSIPVVFFLISGFEKLLDIINNVLES